MGRRQLLQATAQLCSRALHHSQALGHVQLGSLSSSQFAVAAQHLFSSSSASSWQSSASQLHTAATPQQHSTHTSSGLPQQQRLWGQSLAHSRHHHQRRHHQTHSALSAKAGFSTSQQMQQLDEDLRVVHAEISENEYHKLADRTLDFLQEKLEVFVEDMDIEGGDVEHAQGVLTVKLGSHGTYVINKQTPNRQIWLSSPVSGPFRYDYHAGSWVYHRDGRELVSQLQQELKQLLGTEPDLVE